MTSGSAARFSRTAALFSVVILVAMALAPQQALAAVGAASYPGDFPDPFIVRDGSTYYAFGTEYGYLSSTPGGFVCSANPADPADPTPCRNIQRLRSTSPNGPWTVLPDGLPQLPRWAVEGSTWAPSVIRVGSTWLMYYTVHHAAANKQCISIATTTSLDLPFTDNSNGPLLCDAIDPAPFVDADGRMFLHWESSSGGVAAIFGQQLSSTALALVGSPSRLLVRDQPWEGPTVEGPAMLGIPPTSTTTPSRYLKYDLFYSANQWTTSNYAIGYAECTGPLGGCRKVTTTGPWYSDNNPTDVGNGPGGQSLFTDTGGQFRMAYHGWNGPPGYSNGSVRAMWINPITFAAGTPIPPATPIATYYASHGSVRAILGSPVGGEYSVGGGIAQNYTGGRIYWSPATGVHEVHGAILSRYLTLGGPAGLLGLPITDETGTPDGVGRYNHFAHGGSIYWTPATGAHAVYGAIRTTWASTGWERGPLGYPTTDETGTPDGVGRYNHFSKAGSIYWTPGTGARAIYGAIRATWARLGWERGRLGYPTTSEYGVVGGRRNDFQHGSITWIAATGAVQVIYR